MRCVGFMSYVLNFSICYECLTILIRLLVCYEKGGGFVLLQGGFRP